MDAVAERVLTVVGIGTIAAVILVCVFLVYVAYPLFASPEITDAGDSPVAVDFSNSAGFQVDEYGVLGWVAFPDATLHVIKLDSGEIVEQHDLTEGREITAASFPRTGSLYSLGFADGSIQLGNIGFQAAPVVEDDLPVSAQSLEEGGTIMVDGVLYSRNDTGYRRHKFSHTADAPVSLAEGAAVRVIDATATDALTVLAALTSDGSLHVRAVRERTNMMTGETTKTLSGGDVEVASYVDSDPPQHLLLMGGGRSLVLAWADGAAIRFDAGNISEPVLAEKFDFIADPEGVITSINFLLGQATVLVGDSTGHVGAWFRIREEENQSTPDGWVMVKGHDLPGGNAPITFLASSARTRTALSGSAIGTVRMFNVTTETLLTESEFSEGHPINAVALGPKEDALFALSDGKLIRKHVDIKHPEGAMAALFLPVWYEGMPEPQHIWQSSSGDDAFEPKLGLIPLIFGTLKATVYSLLFGVPIALLAAIYTSEFLRPRVKNYIKPTIELMASLPSVVLGFIAALVLAPIVENIVPEIILAVFMLPVIILFSAKLWQLLPQRVARRLSHFRLLFILATIGIGLWVVSLGGATFEHIIFAGDIHSYLAGTIGTGVGAWMLLLVPISAVAVTLLNGAWAGPMLRARTMSASRETVVLVDLLQYVACVLVTLAVAYFLASLLNSIGLDPRGGSSYVGTYVQRNAMIIGFVMGFAIIPIIYTIAEDSLSTVPQHLRAASLGAGATQWQTAIRIVLPAAMSGLFSAVMIGLGRAVGETMIVLMAAGNTPTMEWNIFNGLRTLAANIAVELPEAPVGGTHYRTLFMAALVLFAMTFVVNTFAELIRLRFRKKASSL